MIDQHFNLFYAPRSADIAIGQAQDGIRHVLSETTGARQAPIYTQQMTEAQLYSHQLMDGVYNYDTLVQEFQPQLGEVNVLMVPGQLYDRGEHKGIYGLAEQDRRKRLIGDVMGLTMNQGHRIINGVAIVGQRAGTVVKKEVEILTVHEVGHAFGLKAGKSISDGHCGNICMMRPGVENGHPLQLGFLLDHAKPFCDDCTQHLRTY